MNPAQSAVLQSCWIFIKTLSNETVTPLKSVAFVVDPETGGTLLHRGPMLNVNLKA